jgi:phosphoglycerate transport regulatory protein PgtC
VDYRTLANGAGVGDDSHLNRTSASLEQLLDTANAENVDLVLTSSPMLLQHLQEHQKLAPFSGAPAASQRLVPESIRATSVAVAMSGFGLLINRSALTTRHLPAPADWDDLTDPRYQGALLMSSPSRSDTNHLMVESLLQQKGWLKGWKRCWQAGNLVTISSRSFGVADKIKSGLGVAGPVIDNYANLLLNDPHLAFSIFRSRRFRLPTSRCSKTASTPAKRGGLFAIC